MNQFNKYFETQLSKN